MHARLWLLCLALWACDDSTGGGTPPPQDAAPADMAVDRMGSVFPDASWHCVVSSVLYQNP